MSDEKCSHDHLPNTKLNKVLFLNPAFHFWLNEEDNIYDEAFGNADITENVYPEPCSEGVLILPDNFKFWLDEEDLYDDLYKCLKGQSVEQNDDENRPL